MSSRHASEHPLTESLRAMDMCTPTTAMHHEAGWSQIASPLKPDMWEQVLESHPDREFARFICSGIRCGFRLGFNYHSCSCKPAKGNMQSEPSYERLNTPGSPVAMKQFFLDTGVICCFLFYPRTSVQQLRHVQFIINMPRPRAPLILDNT